MSWAVWITGVPGSGKSAIARAVAAELAARGTPAQLLEMDALRRTLTPAPTYDMAERDAAYRALVVITRALTRAGRPVLIDATGHRRAWRDLARAMIDAFAEVQLVCPLPVARERERTRAPGNHPRAIYARAGVPDGRVPGVDLAYEAATAPELTIDTTHETIASAAARVAALAHGLARATAGSLRREGWTLWISGRPGSGKTTIAADVCERLGRRGIPVTVLEQAEFLATIAPDGRPTAAQREMAVRALVAAAQYLAATGVGVVVDGGAPRGDAGRLAREHIASFAVVELACPPDVCRTRERAVRWNLVARPVAVAGTAATTVHPDLALDYEPPLTPDLTLYTDVLDAWTAAEEVLHLVARLERAANERRTSCA